MSEHRIVTENRHFGRYLRRIREDRKLSLDAVEEMTMGYPEPVTKSHLSRIENGRAVPTFPRMFALCQIYGVPISSMAERFETDLRRGDRISIDATDPDRFLGRLSQLRKAGRHDSILSLTASALESLSESDAHDSNELFTTITIWHIQAMIKLGHYESAKVKSEKILSQTPNDSEAHLRALICFVMTSYRLKRFAVALMGLRQISQLLDKGEWEPSLCATAHGIQGPVHHAIGDLDRAKECFESSIELFRKAGNGYEACKARINLGQVLIDTNSLGAARRHLTQSLEYASDEKFDWLISLATSHLTVLNYKHGSVESAESYALRSNALARPNGYRTILFRNIFYLWQIALDKEDLTAMNSNERTLRALSNRIHDSFPELDQFRRFAEGGDQ